ncbi:MAG: hypothetical protein NTY77_05950 [Elusimicrobia bacterium]|nr:hypothetical protein [Elusimicrobiota bacterium]
MRRAIGAAALLAVFLGLAPAAAWSLDPDTMEMVKAFVKMPTSELPADSIPRFLAVDPAELPAKLRKSFLAKRVELYTLKQLADGKKRGGVRMPEADCAVPKEGQSDSAEILLLAGYEEINDLEEDYVLQVTKCTEHDLMCEFSLQVLAQPKGKKGGPRRRLFLHQNDPAFALVGLFRQHGKASTHFFGVGGVSCAPRLK